ncbi:MAG TPA: hypothetical protein PKO41_07345, partial [Dokdonella sp.]|nr:hypothetical protein [Dokdonella sp.]
MAQAPESILPPLEAGEPSAVTGPVGPGDAELAAFVDGAMATALEDEGIAGAVVAVVDRSRTRLLRGYGHEPRTIAHFLIRLLFCLFAEDAGLLPGEVFTRLVLSAHRRSDVFATDLAQLFTAMAKGGRFAMHDIPYFDGRLFDQAEV